MNFEPKKKSFLYLNRIFKYILLLLSVIKVFVANPNKAKPIQDILQKNKEKLLSFLASFHNDRSGMFFYIYISHFIIFDLFILLNVAHLFYYLMIR